MKLLNWFRRGPSQEELREEVDAHLAMRAEHEGAGTHSAHRRFGNSLQTEEQMRRVWIASYWDTLLQDIHYTGRGFRRNPGFALTAILVLALGLGSATALYSVLDRILFRHLPYPHDEQLVSVGLIMPGSPVEIMPDRGYTQFWHPAPEPFESVATIFVSGGPCDVTEQQPERLSCARVEANLLHVLGRNVQIGRDFTEQDDVPGAPGVALIRYGLWQRRYSGDTGVLGRSLNLDGKPVTIVGVLPADFEMPVGIADLVMPQQLAPIDPAANFTRFVPAIGRLRAGVTLQQAAAAIQPRMTSMMQLLGQRMREQARVSVRSLRDRQVGDAPRVAWLLLAAVGTLLLVACMNVTNLMLARVSARRHEFATRSALGAGKARLARLALTESLLLAISAGALGLALAYALLHVFVTLAPAGIPKIDQASLDARVFMVAAVLTLLCGVAVGLWPAVTVLRANTLHGVRATTGIKPRARFALITAQIALTVAMLGSSAVLLRSLWNVVRVPLGFDSGHVVTLSATLNRAKYPGFERQSAFFDQLLERARQLPGTVSAALSDAPPPMGMAVTISNLGVEGRPDSKNETGPQIRLHLVTPAYFETFQIPIVSGRTFSEGDGQTLEPAAILTESTARLIFPGENAVGKRVRSQSMEPWHVVVGVVKEIRNGGPVREAQPEVYLARRAGSTSNVLRNLAVRSNADPAVTAALLRQIVADLDHELPVNIQTVDSQVANLTARPRFVAWLLAAFAGVTLLLAAAGLYGVAAYLVTQRTRDIGVRMALGATRGNIVRQLLAETARWIAAGLVLGLCLAWASGQTLKSQLVNTPVSDGLSWGLALAILLAALLIAVLRPAARAAGVNPVDALRAE